MVWNKTIVEARKYIKPICVILATEETSTVTSWTNPHRFPERYETSYGLQTSMVAIPMSTRSFSFSFKQYLRFERFFRVDAHWSDKIELRRGPNLSELLTVSLPCLPGMCNVAMPALGTRSWCVHPGIVFELPTTWEEVTHPACFAWIVVL